MSNKASIILERLFVGNIRYFNTVTEDSNFFHSQIYRGPSVGKGYDVFAPWGYYDTQPADFHKKKYH